MFLSGIKPRSELYSYPPLFLTSQPTMENVSKVLSDKVLLNILNSLIIAVDITAMIRLFRIRTCKDEVEMDGYLSDDIPDFTDAATDNSCNPVVSLLQQIAPS